MDNPLLKLKKDASSASLPTDGLLNKAEQIWTMLDDMAESDVNSYK
jgi:hypothetical protein